MRVHLEGCSDCERTLEELTAVQGAAQKLHFESPTGEEWSHIHNYILGRLSRRMGWLILVVWALMMCVYSLYWYARTQGSLFEKLAVFGLIAGLGLLFFSVLSERIRDFRTDRYKGVHR